TGAGFGIETVSSSMSTWGAAQTLNSTFTWRAIIPESLLTTVLFKRLSNQSQAKAFPAPSAKVPEVSSYEINCVFFTQVSKEALLSSICNCPIVACHAC